MKLTTLNKNSFTLLSIVLVALLLVSCKKETRDKLKQAKDQVSNTTSVLNNAKEISEKSKELKELEPLTNEELKAWLPENIEGMQRTGFKVGKAGYMNVSSIEGTFKGETGKQIKIEVIDGAGPTGSMMMMSLNMASKMEMEEEDENKHLKTVDYKNTKAQQTYYKKRNDTKIQFVHGERFAVIVNANDMNPEDTWSAIDGLDLEDLE